MSTQPFSRLDNGGWALTKDGYTVTVEARSGGGMYVTVTNPHGDVVSEGAELRHVFREARWALDSAIESGE